MMEC